MPYTYDTDVKSLLETVDQELKAFNLIYELKDLYKRVERSNLGELYRHPLSIILEIIQLPDDNTRMEHILHELKLYDFVPEIKKFVWNLTKNPLDVQNMSNSGKGEKIFTLVEKVENGYMAFIADRWFMIDDKGIKQVLVEDYVKEEERVRELRILEQALTIGEIVKDRFTIKVDENITLGISTKNDKSIYVNEDKLDPETTLESIFASPIIPYLKKDYFLMTNAIKENISNLIELI